MFTFLTKTKNNKDIVHLIHHFSFPLKFLCVYGWKSIFYGKKQFLSRKIFQTNWYVPNVSKAMNNICFFLKDHIMWIINCHKSLMNKIWYNIVLSRVIKDHPIRRSLQLLLCSVSSSHDLPQQIFYVTSCLEGQGINLLWFGPCFCILGGICIPPDIFLPYSWMEVIIWSNFGTAIML